MEEKLEEIDQLVTQNDVVIFMKGNPEQPMCGFSEAAVEVLNHHGVDFESRDVLLDDGLRQAVKEYADWPTVPQIYIDGEFVGGSDILREMHASGDLADRIETLDQ